MPKKSLVSLKRSQDGLPVIPNSLVDLQEVLSSPE